MPKILVVDDEVSLRFLIVETLEDKGYEIFEAKDGSDALETLKNITPDLLILDVMMPGMTGYEVLERIKDAKGSMKVMLLTAKAQNVDREKGIAAGADFFFTKPFSPLELATYVYEILKNNT